MCSILPNSMCGRFEQSETRKYYTRALGLDEASHEWTSSSHISSDNILLSQCSWTVVLRNGKPEFIRMAWGYRTPQETAAKKKPWINVRIERASTGRYFRHMFREGRVIIPAAGWYEWTVENGEKQSWYITRRTDDPMFIAGITNWKPYTQQTVETGFVIVTEDSTGGMVDVHDRRPVVLEPEDARRWIDSGITVDEAAHLARARSLPVEEFKWWRVHSQVDSVDPTNAAFVDAVSNPA